MHEQTEIEKKLKPIAIDLSKPLNGAPVVIIVGGSSETQVPITMTATSFEPGGGRMRDLLGILQASIQIESMKHLRPRGSE
jgi:hypothetical protein